MVNLTTYRFVTSPIVLVIVAALPSPIYFYVTSFLLSNFNGDMQFLYYIYTIDHNGFNCTGSNWMDTLCGRIWFHCSKYWVFYDINFYCNTVMYSMEVSIIYMYVYMHVVFTVHH